MSRNLEKILQRCRLCQSNPGTVEVHDDEFISKVFECTKIKIDIDHTHIFPKTVCMTCKLSIEDFFNFVQEIRLVDQKLQDQISKCQSSECKLLQCKTEVKNEKAVNNDNRFKCPACSKTYARYKNLQLHKRGHPNLHCTKCESTFDDVLARKTHTCSVLKEQIKSVDDDDNEDIPLQLRIGSSDAEKTKSGYNVSNVVESENVSELKKEWFEDEFASSNKGAKVANENSRENCILDVPATNHERLSEIDVNRKNKAKGNHMCEVCNEIFMSAADLRVHQKIHGITFTCTYENCSKVCTSAYTLRTHLMKHEGKMPFLCVTCGKGFTTKNSLNCHEKTHAKVKGYVCKECNIGFSVASNLRAHQKKHHEGVRFYCSQCTRAFITKCSLERHELVHTGVKEFKCESCRAAFYTNKELLKHQRYHQGLRLYKCDQCFKTFFEKHHLTIHIRVHTGERPYACKVAGCGKSFTESQKLSRHIKARHPAV